MADETETPDEGTGAPATTEELLTQLLEAQEANRKELAAMRAEIDSRQPPRPSGAPLTQLSPEEALSARMDTLNQHDWYCPGCGAVFHYQRECTGRGEAPHAPIDVVSTKEVTEGEPSDHTPAPNSENLG